MSQLLHPRRIWQTLLIMSVFASVALLIYRHPRRLSVPSYSLLPGWTSSTVKQSSNQTRIPTKIWQMHLKPNIETDTIVDTLSWIAKNPDYHYQLLGGPGAEEFVMKHFPQHLDLYKSIPNTGSKSDLLRYMLLAVEGGIYTDLDTVALQPVDSWIPPHYKDQARVIIGLEYDQRDDDFVFAELHPTIQFCQWTIAAAPGHKIFDNMVQQAVDSLKKFEQEYDLPISNITLKNPEVLSSTGPGAWTDVVFEGLKIADPSITTLKNISRLSEPRLYGDILLLPIDAFGMGQVHSGSTRGDDIPKNALAKHNFRGHWRTKEES